MTQERKPSQYRDRITVQLSWARKKFYNPGAWPTWDETLAILLINGLVLEPPKFTYKKARVFLNYMSFNVRKYTFRHVRPAKIQISLHIHTVIRIFTRPILDSWELKVSLCGQQGLWSDCRADLSLCCVPISDGTFFFHAAAKMSFYFRELTNIASWDDKVLHDIVDNFLHLRFPVLLVLNKADMQGADIHIQRYWNCHHSEWLSWAFASVVL